MPQLSPIWHMKHVHMPAMPAQSPQPWFTQLLSLMYTLAKTMTWNLDFWVPMPQPSNNSPNTLHKSYITWPSHWKQTRPPPSPSHLLEPKVMKFSKLQKPNHGTRAYHFFCLLQHDSYAINEMSKSSAYPCVLHASNSHLHSKWPNSSHMFQNVKTLN